MLSWSPGHDGFSPILKCHIRVRLLPGQTAAGRRHCGPHDVVSDECKVKEVSRRKGEVTTTRLINVTAPPFQHEVPGLQAVTRYNVSVSCSNEVGASPVTTWIQSNTTEGGVWVHSGCFYSFYLFWFFPSSYFLYCAERFPIQVAVWRAGMFGNRSYMRRSQQGLVTKMPNPLDLCVFPSLKGHIGNSEITFQGWGSSKFPSFPHRRGLFSRMVSTVLGSGRAPNCQKKKKKTSMEVFFLRLCNCFSPSLFSVSCSSQCRQCFLEMSAFSWTGPGCWFLGNLLPMTKSTESCVDMTSSSDTDPTWTKWACFHVNIHPLVTPSFLLC